MPFMEELRKLFRLQPKEPVEIDLTGTQAEGLGEAARSNGDRTGDGSLAAVNRRKPSLAEVQRGYDEVMGLVRKIGDHLDAQTKRTERLVELMEHLPEAIDSLPEVQRQNSRLLETIGEHLAHSRQRDETLNGTLTRLNESSSQQSETLDLLRHQFDSSTRASEQMTNTLGSFSDALTNLAENNNRSTDVLANLMRSTEERESRLVETIGRMQKWVLGILIGVGVLAIGAIVLAAMAILR